MARLNEIKGIGRLVRDAEILTMDNGNKLVKNCIAIDDNYKVKETQQYTTDRTIFLDVQAWGYSGDHLCKLKKGDLVYIGGKIKQNNWTDKETGKPRKSLYISVENCFLIANPKNKSEGGYSQGSAADSYKNQNSFGRTKEEFDKSADTSENWATPPMDEPPF